LKFSSKILKIDKFEKLSKRGPRLAIFFAFGGGLFSKSGQKNSEN